MTAPIVPTTPAPDGLVLSPVKRSGLADQMKAGLDAPICLTWELTYACNLQCVHCLSSSGRRDPRELTTAEAEGVIDEFTNDLEVFRRDLAHRDTIGDDWSRINQCRCAGLQGLVHGVAAGFLNADDADVGGYRLNVGCDAGNETTSADRNQDRINRACGFCAQQFNPDGTLTGSHQGVIERMDI